MKKRRKDSNQPEEADTEGWQIVYTGFILIMLCFFIMLCAFSKMEASKITQFVRSFSHAVSILPGGFKVTDGELMLIPSADIVEPDSALAQLFWDVQQMIRDMGLDDVVKLELVQRGLIMRLKDTLLFDPGSADILRGARPLMDKLAVIIDDTEYQVRIEGHADDMPISTPRFPSNWELSAARATTVLRFFLEEKNIAAERLAAAGFGEFNPLVPNVTPENRAINRRVEIVLIRPPSPVNNNANVIGYPENGQIQTSATS